MTPALKKWLLAVLLPLPLYALFISHYLSAPPGGTPTGFMQLDTPLYTAKIRQIAEAPAIRLTYSGPCDPSYQAPRIYFQTHMAALGLLARFTHIPAHYMIILFHILASILFARLAIAVLERAGQLRTVADWFIILLFFWGGGVICFGGIVSELVAGHGLKQALFQAFKYDPGQGWWFLNLGRNIALPIEAYYHILALGVLLAVMKEKYRIAFLLCVVLCFTHVVTSFQVIGILAAWAFTERYFLRTTTVPRWFPWACIPLLAGIILYYIVFLNMFPEHRAFIWQGYEPLWQIDAKHFIPGYALVAGLAFWQFRTVDHARACFSISNNRLFLVWALVSFALENHEFLGVSIEPAHFARGYVWMALFLLGLPALRSILGWIVSRCRPSLATVVFAALLIFFSFDNIVWFSAVAYERRYIQKNKGDYYLSGSITGVLEFLEKQDGDTLVVSEDTLLGYMTIVYTPLRSWTSHHGETPNYLVRLSEIREFFADGKKVPAWDTRPVLVIARREPETRRSDAFAGVVGTNVVYQNTDYIVYRMPRK